MKLDEQGWRELAGLNAGSEISAPSAARLSASGEEGIEVRSMQMMFEMPGHAGAEE